VLGCPEKDRWDNLLLGRGFLRTLREWISGFHDRLRQRPSSLFMLFGCSSISLASVEAARTSETSVGIYLTTLQYIPEDSELHTRRPENLKSHVILYRCLRTGV
jgi:hypothetical protein